MLARDKRVNDPAEFRAIMRKGRKLSTPEFITYVMRNDDPSRGGLIVANTVSKSAVVRNAIKRAVRDEMEAFIAKNPTGFLIVVRALPAAVDSRRSVRFPS